MTEYYNICVCLFPNEVVVYHVLRIVMLVLILLLILMNAPSSFIIMFVFSIQTQLDLRCNFKFCFQKSWHLLLSEKKAGYVAMAARNTPQVAER